ncbi:hypothetical protein [Streptomyces antibioticus]|uniref:hypothetical protein n=1 Tax=Streptomyces antibioticus TaxID=1890 RepID=UPI002252A14E|nr:hypothetical protein [Streptomyces antibioticus]MCX4743789.1 hypothetical protein [Streptomyces antibioticus]
MSNVVKFFAASRADAFSALVAGPTDSFPVVLAGNFDVEEALLDWEAHLTGRSFVELVEDDIPEVVAESEDGPIVLALSPVLSDTLASASDSRIEELIEWWTVEKARDGVMIDRIVARSIIRDLVGLIRRDGKTGDGVYCWAG